MCGRGSVRVGSGGGGSGGWACMDGCMLAWVNTYRAPNGVWSQELPKGLLKVHDSLTQALLWLGPCGTTATGGCSVGTYVPASLPLGQLVDRLQAHSMSVHGSTSICGCLPVVGCVTTNYWQRPLTTGNERGLLELRPELS